MTEKNFDFENEKEFNELIESSFGELPPDYLTNEVTPWKKAIQRIIWGLALCGVTVQLLGLQYILPAAGMIMVLLGFRSLRWENNNFKAGYVISIMRTAAYMLSIVFDATIYRSTEWGEIFNTAIIVFNMISLLILLVCLKYAFIAVKEKAGFEGGVGGATALIIWEIIVMVLALINYQGLIIPIITLISYIFIIKSLLTLSKELDEAGYAIQAAPVKVSDRALTVTICSTLAVGILCGYLFFNAYPMKWALVETPESAKITEIKENLLELGFPEDILNDISDEDILECEGALHVAFDSEIYYMGSRWEVYDPSHNNLQITGIGVKLPNEGECWKIFHHFQWVKRVWFYGTESLQIYPSYGYKTDWIPISDISGRVLYDNGEKTYAAPYYFLGNKTYTSEGLLGGEYTASEDFATFSLPQNGENQRGYISYSIEASREDPFITTWLNYTHQISPFQYPVQSAMERRMYDEGISFVTECDVFQLSPQTDMIDLSEESETIIESPEAE